MLPARLRMRRFGPLVLGAAVVVLTATIASAGTPTGVRTTRRSEFGATANANYLAWTQDEAGHLNHFHVWVKPTGQAAFQVDQAGRAFTGQVDPMGTTLVYFFLGHGNYDVRLYDMSTKTRTAAPPNVNTAQNEYWPGLSSTQLTFVRESRTAARLYLVTDMTTGAKVVVKSIDTSKSFFPTPPRLMGNWVTYAVCTARITSCKAYRYDISGSTTRQIPNPRHLFYFAPSADLAGNVYLERSGRNCGDSARLMKWTAGGGNPTSVYAFARRTDLTGTSVFDDNAGTVIVYVDFYDCPTGAGDIFSFTNPS
jgi:hypothetical protein